MRKFLGGLVLVFIVVDLFRWLNSPVPAGKEGAASVAPVTQPASAALPTRTYRVSLAFFDGDQLEQCTESETAPAAGQESLVIEGIKKTEAAAEKVIVTWKGNDKPLILAKGCAEQFADRTVLATCVTVRDTELGRVTATDRYYNLSTVGDSDAEMHKCLAAHGDWQPNTNKWAVEHERIRGQMKLMQKIAEETKAD